MYKQGVGYVSELGVVCEAPRRSRKSRRTCAFHPRRHIYSARPMSWVKGRLLNGAMSRRGLPDMQTRFWWKQRVAFQNLVHIQTGREEEMQQQQQDGKSSIGCRFAKSGSGH